MEHCDCEEGVLLLQEDLVELLKAARNRYESLIMLLGPAAGLLGTLIPLGSLSTSSSATPHMKSATIRNSSRLIFSLLSKSKEEFRTMRGTWWTDGEVPNPG